MLQGGKMSKIKDIISSIAIGVMLGIIIFEVIFAIRLYMRSNDDQSIDVKMEYGETEIVEFEKFGLIPGESTEYTLYLSTSDGSTSHVTMEFSEQDDSPLGDFVRVKILVNDEELCDELLADLFGGNDVTISGDISSDEFKVTLVYYMPEEVGNEAENAEAWFNVNITAQFI
jgi:hypothetical protein